MNVNPVITPCFQKLQKCDIEQRDIVYWIYITVVWVEGVHNSKVLKNKTFLKIRLIGLFIEFSIVVPAEF